MTWEQMRVNWATSPVRDQITGAMERAVSAALAALVPVLPEEVRRAAAKAAVAAVDEAVAAPVQAQVSKVIITDHRG
jgi:hypothetical protein